MSHDVFDDEYDPLAPIVDAGPQPEPNVDAVPSAPTDAPEVADPGDVVDDSDGGFSDADRIVRVWLEDGRLSKVRVSPVWFHKLTGKDTLGGRFGHALQLANTRVAGFVEDPEEEPEFPAEIAALQFTGLPRLNKVTMAAFDEVFREYRARFADAIERHQGHSPHPVATVSGRAKGVVVNLDEHGRAASVEFDEAWLDQAQVGAICANVQQAADDAYSKYVPVEPEVTELDELRTEGLVLRAVYRAMLKPGGRDV